METSEAPARCLATGRGACAEELSARRVRGCGVGPSSVGAQGLRTERLRLTRPMATDSAGVFAIQRDATMDCQGNDGLDWAFTSPPIQ